jgi:hypothetical protein
LNTIGRSGFRSRGVAFRTVDVFERYVRAGLELADVPVDDVDMAVMRAADATYGPGMRALAAADLREVMPEIDLDPSRAPRTA